MQVYKRWDKEDASTSSIKDEGVLFHVHLMYEVLLFKQKSMVEVYYNKKIVPSK